MDPIYVFGHRNPDTDSIVSAMAYAALHNALGDNEYIAAMLGRPNDETRFLLERFGFACEDFGDGAIIVREVPADIDAEDTTATLEEFAQNLRSGRSLEEKRENLLHTMACKAAIKGGWKSDTAELKVLVEKVCRGEVKYCPHGRPVAVKLTKYELEKMFKRA